MQKILFVITKSNFGGAQRYLYDLATNLPRDEFDVVVAFGPGPDGKPGRLAHMLGEKGVRTILIPELTRDMHARRDWKAFRSLTNLFRTEKPDIVHLNSSKVGGLGSLAARLAGIPRIIFTSHGLPFDEDRNIFSKLLIRFATWCTTLFAHATVAVSQDTFERMRRMPFLYRKVFLIHNGIATPVFLSRNDAREEIRTLDAHLPLETFWIGSIGELHRNKNYTTAIDALAKISFDAHLILIGEGEMRATLLAHAHKRGLERRVHCVGAVPDAAQYIRAFDCFVLPSHKEGLPYVLLEAGYGYVPVIGSDITGVRDIILHNFTGLSMPPNDPDALAHEIERIHTDARLARSLSDELLKRVQKNFSLETMLEKTISLYRR